MNAETFTPITENNIEEKGTKKKSRSKKHNFHNFIHQLHLRGVPGKIDSDKIRVKYIFKDKFVLIDSSGVILIDGVEKRTDKHGIKSIEKFILHFFR
ncbi:hypothetical protein [Roseibacillus persicicus]|nr:hypothetical protein [Roseibacillus persicicus]